MVKEMWVEAEGVKVVFPVGGYWVVFCGMGGAVLGAWHVGPGP